MNETTSVTTNGSCVVIIMKSKAGISGPRRAQASARCFVLELFGAGDADERIDLRRIGWVALLIAALSLVDVPQRRFGSYWKGLTSVRFRLRLVASTDS